MALIIEDGSGVANANSFGTVAGLRAFATLRGVNLAPTDGAVEVLLIKAMDWLTAQTYIGEMTYEGQSVPFPRTDLDGYADNVIPAEIVTAQYHLALAANKGIDLMPTQAKAAIKRKKVGPLETEYFGVGPAIVRVPAVDGLLLGFLSGSLRGQLRVERA